MSFEIIKGDISAVKADVIVNAANPRLKRGGGVCGAIFRAAGIDELTAEIQGNTVLKMHRPPGECVITAPCKLAANGVKKIFHVVSVRYFGGKFEEAEKLKFCYTNALIIAESMGFQSVVFPLMGAGAYGFPREKAIFAAVSAISEFAENSDLRIYLCLKGAE
jgi:O-acetyl-ADP-ribose deacetylase (regulator of RNase III)